MPRRGSKRGLEKAHCVLKEKMEGRSLRKAREICGVEGKGEKHKRRHRSTMY